jgi:hypothetical protein
MDKYIQRIETENPNPNSIRYITVGDLESSLVSISTRSQDSPLEEQQEKRWTIGYNP